jgi:hypothetical protein
MRRDRDEPGSREKIAAHSAPPTWGESLETPGHQAALPLVGGALRAAMGLCGDWARDSPLC